MIAGYLLKIQVNFFQLGYLESHLTHLNPVSGPNPACPSLPLSPCLPISPPSPLFSFNQIQLTHNYSQTVETNSSSHMKERTTGKV